MRSTRTVRKSGWSHGPSWGSIAFALLVLGLLGASFGFNAALYAEYGARTVERIDYEYPPGSDELEGDPGRPVTVTVAGYGKSYSFSGTQAEADRWKERTMDRLFADQELPAVRSKIGSFGGTLLVVAVVFMAAGLVLGVWRALGRSVYRRDHRHAGGAAVSPAV